MSKSKIIVNIFRKALRPHLNEVEDHDPPGGAKSVVEEINNKHSHLMIGGELIDPKLPKTKKN